MGKTYVGETEIVETNIIRKVDVHIMQDNVDDNTEPEQFTIRVRWKEWDSEGGSGEFFMWENNPPHGLLDNLGLTLIQFRSLIEESIKDQERDGISELIEFNPKRESNEPI